MQTKKTVTWRAWGHSDPGKKRENNEDRILCDEQNGIFVVVDGMGGEAAGEVAAQNAVDYIKERLYEQTGTAARRLGEAIAGANNEIFRLAEKNPQWRGMACVLTAALVEDHTLHIGHVGDSRLYKIQGDTIRKLTQDHSPVGQKEDSGALTELEAMRHPRRNEVFRDVGSQWHKPDDDEFIQYLQVPFDSDAAYVICSDGLSDMLTSREILSVVLENAGNPRNAVQQLIEKANAAGGKDNVSAVVIEAEEFASEAPKVKSRSRSGRGSSSFGSPSKVLLGKWAFLIYGLIGGFIAFAAWNHLAGSNLPAGVDVGTAEDASSVRSPRVLVVNSSSSEFRTIRSALESAVPGDRIEIEDGEYEESVRLKDGVEMSARNPGKAILRISRALPDTEAAIEADGVKTAVIAGLIIRVEPAAALPFGIKLLNSSVTVLNMEVSGAVRAGLLVEGTSAGVITGNYLHANSGPGIVTGGSSSPLVTGNLFYANGISRRDPLPGMYVTGNSTPDVKRNIFSANGAEPIRIQKQELKERMMSNLFVNSRRGREVMVERNRQ